MPLSRPVAVLLFSAVFLLSSLPPAQAETKKTSSKKTSSSAKATPALTPFKKKTAKASPTPGKSTTKTALAKKATAATPDAAPPVQNSPSEKTAAGFEKSAEASATPAPEKKAAPDAAPKTERAPSATVEPEAITEFAALPAKIQQLIRDAIDLTRQNLTYTFGSADPAKGGMDCSGTMYYLLRSNGFSDTPRDSSGQYLWAQKTGAFFPVVSANAESVEFAQMQPGDLMFWTGTYSTGRDVPISHVMLYLGREKGTKKRIMFGASDGRSYNGVQRWGVSVFDFKMPRVDPANPEKAKVDFVGYARIPGLRADVAVADASDEIKDLKEAVRETARSGPEIAPKSKSSGKKTKARE